jgi:hypothetical protein
LLGEAIRDGLPLVGALLLQNTSAPICQETSCGHWAARPAWIKAMGRLAETLLNEGMERQPEERPASSQGTERR